MSNQEKQPKSVLMDTSGGGKIAGVTFDNCVVGGAVEMKSGVGVIEDVNFKKSTILQTQATPIKRPLWKRLLENVVARTTAGLLIAFILYLIGRAVYQ